MNLFKKTKKNFKKTLLRGVLVLSLAVGSSQASEATRFHTTEVNKVLTEMKVSAKKVDLTELEKQLDLLQKALTEEAKSIDENNAINPIHVSSSFKRFIDKILEFTVELSSFESKLHKNPESTIRSSAKLFVSSKKVLSSLAYFKLQLLKFEEHENLTKEIKALNRTLVKNMLGSLELIQKTIDEKTLTELEKYAKTVDPKTSFILEQYMDSTSSFYHVFPVAIENFTSTLIKISKYLPEEETRVKKVLKKWEKHISKRIDGELERMTKSILELDKKPELELDKYDKEFLKKRKEKIKELENLKALL